MSRATIYKCDVCDYSSEERKEFSSIWIQIGHTQNNIREVCEPCQKGLRRGFSDLCTEIKAAALAGRGKG